MKSLYPTKYNRHAFIRGEYYPNDSRYDASMIALAKQVIEESANIPDFAFWGKLDNGDPIPVGESWGFTIMVLRDSDILSRSNWEVIRDDMVKRYPSYALVCNLGHFAYGWVDRLLVHMIDDRGMVTRAGVAILNWKNRLDRYPVANEDHFSRMEYEEYSDTMHSELKYWIRQYGGKDSDDDIDTLISVMPNSYVREISHLYDVAWDHEGWIDTRESEDILIPLAFCLNMIDAYYPAIQDRIVKLWGVMTESNYGDRDYSRRSKIAGYLWREIVRLSDEEYATQLMGE